MLNVTKQVITRVPPAALAIGLSVIALLSAYISQYGFRMQPCILCLYQRVPYAIIILLGAIALAFKRYYTIEKLALWLIIAAFLIGAGIAAYHVGVEQGVFILSTACDDLSTTPDSVEAMMRQLLTKEAVPCDKPQFVLFGLSMAAWNMAYALCCAGYMIIEVMKRR